MDSTERVVFLYSGDWGVSIKSATTIVWQTIVCNVYMYKYIWWLSGLKMVCLLASGKSVIHVIYDFVWFLTTTKPKHIAFCFEYSKPIKVLRSRCSCFSHPTSPWDDNSCLQLDPTANKLQQSPTMWLVVFRHASLAGPSWVWAAVLSTTYFCGPDYSSTAPCYWSIRICQRIKNKSSECLSSRGDIRDGAYVRSFSH